MVHVSTLYGLGQDQAAIWAAGPDRLTAALLYLIVAQIFGVATMGVAKVSLGLLLLRLVTVRWHRWAIWGAIALLFVVTGVTSFVFAFQCSPPAYLWDKTIRGGHCPIPITPYAVVLGTACVAADLFFALFPHLFVWRLNRPLRERALIAAAMSLGLGAAACGVKRTIGLGGLASDNYTRDAVPTCAWSIAELAITLVCIAVPVCLPLAKQAAARRRRPRRAAADDPSDPSAASSGGLSAGPRKPARGAGVFALRTFGGSPLTGLSSQSRRTQARSEAREDDAESERALRPTPSPETQPPLEPPSHAAKASLPVVAVFVESATQTEEDGPGDAERARDLERQ